MQQWRILAALSLAWGAGGLGPAAAQTNHSGSSRRFSAAEQIAIARAFAPMLVFHEDERYFPISSMFQAERRGEADSTTTLETPDQLGSAEERAAQYVQFSQQEKLARAAVGYRVFSRFKRGQIEVVVEYWCHYVYNEFTIRGTWLPYRISGNHLQDLERLFFVLAPSSDAPRHADVVDEAWARQAFHIERIVANAHDGSVPPNEYDVRHGKPVSRPVTILVEHGSHAMAPDINHDGRFTPAEDSTTTNKLLWGIRDGGRPWGWYRKAQMDTRAPGRTVRLCVSSATQRAQAPLQNDIATGSPDGARWNGDGPVSSADGATQNTGKDCGPYDLYPIENLQRWFDDLKLSDEDRREVLGHTSWFTRPFGTVKVEDLLVPNDPPDGSVLDHMLRRHHRVSQGAVAGYGTLNNSPAFVVGGRYFNDIPSLKWPDFVAEGFAMFQDDQHVNAKVSAFGSYALDVTTNVVLGVDWIANARRPTDLVAGIEFRVGRLLVRPSWRLRERVYDTLVVAIF